MDIFSYGMVLFELLSGERPFKRVKYQYEIHLLVSDGERPRLLDYNRKPTFPNLVNLMKNCWKHLANDRPTGGEVSV